jgi:hypothetical protein
MIHLSVEQVQAITRAAWPLAPGERHDEPCKNVALVLPRTHLLTLSLWEMLINSELNQSPASGAKPAIARLSASFGAQSPYLMFTPNRWAARAIQAQCQRSSLRRLGQHQNIKVDDLTGSPLAAMNARLIIR